MRPAVIAGARPNFPKVAPLLRAMEGCGVEPAFVHTGQHYDWSMSRSFFEDLSMPEPTVNLGVGSGSHAGQTARIMVAFDGWLDSTEVDCVVTVGDVNSTLACSLVAAKRGVPVAHIEAGLRSHDPTMPEEINRVLTDRLSEWLFTTSADAGENLLHEGIDRDRIHFVGNLMVDSLLASLERAMESSIRRELGLPDKYGLVTLHRPALVDDPSRFGPVLAALEDISSELPLVFPIHPRTRANLESFGFGSSSPGLLFTSPLGYLDFICLEAQSALVLTDSGGIQEETTVLGVPCLTLRENTERPVTITQGTNRLVGTSSSAIAGAARSALRRSTPEGVPPLWDGHAAERVVEVLSDAFAPEPRTISLRSDIELHTPTPIGAR